MLDTRPVCTCLRRVGLACAAGILVGLTPAVAQPPVVAEPVPGLGGIAASIDQVTRDGSRIVVRVAPSAADAYTLVLDTLTGATVFDSRPVQTSTRSYRSAQLSPDGAFLVDADHAVGTTVRARHLVSGTEQVVFQDAFGDLEIQAVADGAASVAGYSGFGLSAGPVVVLGGAHRVSFFTTCRAAAALMCLGRPVTMSADGSKLAYRFSGWSDLQQRHHQGIVLADAVPRATRVLPILHPDLATAPWPGEPRTLVVSGDGRWVGFTAATAAGNEPRVALFDGVTGHIEIVASRLGRTEFHDVSDDGRFVLLATAYSPSDGQQLHVVDRLSGIVSPVRDPLDAPIGSYRVLSAHLSGDARTVVATLADATTFDPTPRRTYIARLDADRDGMNDVWEATFGLDPSNPADAAQDADGDGTSSAHEYAAGTHPRATPVRYFAEGADGSFFATTVALFNTSTASVTANLRFLGPDGAAANLPVTLPAGTPVFVQVARLGLPFREFGIVVEGPVSLATERRMTWPADAYGSHSGTGVAAPATTWHFAEGASVAGLQTFFLLQNPGDAAATASMRYLLASGATEVRTHIVPARSRLTVWANKEGTPLDAAEFATTVVADVPIVAERAMYRDAPGEPFSAGAVASGVTTPATSWFFAEGATGPFFDTYLLLANPGDTHATVDVEFVRAHDVSNINTALPITRQYVVPARSRRTIWIAREDDALRDTQVGARINASAPIVAERTMWWPGPTSSTWRENHTEIGSTTSGRLWAVADMQADSAIGGWDTFLMVATTEQYVARIRVTLSCADGTTMTRDKALSVNRTTLWMRYEFPELVDRRCAATVESLPSRTTSSPLVPLYRVPLVVEAAMYRGDFAAGGVTLATRLPDPPQ